MLAEHLPDEARALQLASRVGQLRSQQYQRFLRSILFVRQTLTPEQFTFISNK